MNEFQVAAASLLPHVFKKKISAPGSSFTEDMKSIGLKAGARLLSYELLRADDIPTIAKKLELGGNDFIHYFVRLRTGNEKPIAISYTYVSAKIIPAINVDCLNASFYEFVDSLGLERELKQLELKATLPTDRQKELLAANNIALLCSSHITYTHIDGFCSLMNISKLIITVIFTLIPIMLQSKTEYKNDVLYTAPELLLAALQKITTISTNWKSQFFRLYQSSSDCRLLLSVL